ERGDVVIGDLLALLDRFDGERCLRPRGRRRLAGDQPLLGHRVGRRQLHRQPGLHAVLRGPYRPHLLARVAGYHALIIRAASSPAFFAPSIATHPTGTPGGIWTAESRASRPPR